MIIEIFSQTYYKTIYELERAVNDFLTSGIEVCDVKITTATAGYSDNMNVLTTIMVLYK